MKQVSTQQQTGDFGPVFGACELIKKKAAGAIIKEEIKRLATSCDHKTMPSVWCGSDIEEIDH